MKKELQIRSYNTEFTADGDSRQIHGLAIPVNSKSEYIRDQLGSYYEIILPEAVTEELIKSNDIKVYLDHDPQQGCYARSKFGEGSLSLYVTERGLEFDFDAPKTAFGDALLEGIKRGDYDKMSFAFYPGEDKWIEDTHYVRSFDRITEISILSLAPAFSATDVELRALEDYKQEKERAYNESVNKINELENSINNLYKSYLDVAYNTNI